MVINTNWEKIKISLKKLEWTSYFAKIDEIIHRN